jgi:hypothetical protein
MTPLKRSIVAACAVPFLLSWTAGISTTIQFVDRSVLLAQQNNPMASYNRGYQLGRKDAKSGRNSDNRRQRNESSQSDSEFRRG